VRKTRSGSGSKTRTSRSGTLSQFQASQLTHSRDSSSASKPKKSVRFDPGTSLIYLCQHGDGTEESLQKVRDCLDAITAMGDSDVDINNVYTPHQWLTPLHVACSHGKTEIAKILLESGAAVNIEDKESWTPLHCAAAEGHVEIIKLLGKCQGNLEDEDKSNPDWIYVLDGPINLEPLNDDNELPEDVALEAKLDDIQKAIAGILNLCRFENEIPTSSSNRRKRVDRR
jgi:ankyrin repeat protein